MKKLTKEDIKKYGTLKEQEVLRSYQTMARPTTAVNKVPKEIQQQGQNAVSIYLYGYDAGHNDGYEEGYKAAGGKV